MIVTKALEIAGMSPAEISAYKRVVEVAWQQFKAERPTRHMMAMTFWLAMQRPHDPDTVVVSVGSDARFGAVSAKSPEALETALLRHLLDRFADVPSSEDQ